MKQSTKAAYLSAFLFPGVGQFYLKKYIKGSIFFIIAAIAFAVIMPAIFSILHSIFEEILLKKITLNNLLYENGIQKITQQVMDTFLDPNVVKAKIAMMGSWLISTADAWLTGRGIEKEQL